MPTETRVPSRWVRILFTACWVGAIITLVAIPASHMGGEHWQYFAIYGQAPVVIDGDLEFGFLGAERPYARPGGSWLANGPYSYYRHWEKPPAIATENRTVWQGAWMVERRGLLIPPWGWRVAPVFAFAPGDVETRGEDPNRAIPYVMFEVPLIYVAALLSVWLVCRWIRQARGRRSWKPGTCRNCGYDLRATPERCRDCGLRQE